MRQARRSFIGSVALAAMIFVFAACGGSGSTESAEEADTVQAETTVAASQSSTETSGGADHSDAEVVTDADHTEAETEEKAGMTASDDDHAGDDQAGDDHGSDEPMAMAAAHDIPEAAASVPNPLAYDAESVAAGAELFAQTCLVCHGPKGLGDGPGAVGLDPKPAMLTADHVQANSDGALFYTISEGRPNTAMVGWAATYSETQRWQLVNFIRSLDAE